MTLLYSWWYSVSVFPSSVGWCLSRGNQSDSLKRPTSTLSYSCPVLWFLSEGRLLVLSDIHPLLDGFREGRSCFGICRESPFFLSN